jgi:hypothetical protein
MIPKKTYRLIFTFWMSSTKRFGTERSRQLHERALLEHIIEERKIPRGGGDITHVSQGFACGGDPPKEKQIHKQERRIKKCASIRRE